MVLSVTEKNELEEMFIAFLNDERIQRMKLIPMHRGSNCFIHSFKVAKLAIKKALRHKLADLKVILIASILHDYYLYDWRKDRSYRKHHTKNHPNVAIQNAVNDFDVSEKVKRIIKTHMWPANFKDFPNSKEARIVSLADKSIATQEFLTSASYKKKKEHLYLEKISHLFD